DAPAYGRLVARMIDTRDPVPRAIRPVVAEAGPASGAVGANDESILNCTVVCDADVKAAAGTLRQRDVDLAGRTREGCSGAVHTHAVDGDVQEIENQRIEARRPLHREHRIGHNRVAALWELERQRVIDDIDAGAISMLRRPDAEAALRR